MIKIGHRQRETTGFDFILGKLSANSPYGNERIRRIRFYSPHEKHELEEELYNVGRAADTLESCAREYAAVERQMMALKDVRRSIERCREGELDEVELFEIKRFLLQLEIMAEAYRLVQERAGFAGINIEPVPGALRALDPDGRRTASFYVSDAKLPRLREIRRRKRELEEKMRLERDGARREKLAQERLTAAVEEEDAQREALFMMCADLRPYLEDIMNAVNAIGRLDFTISRAKLAARYGACLPTMDGDRLALERAVHPLFVDALNKKGRAFTPISIEIAPGSTVITGANMGGKSVALKTIAVNALMLHAGMFVFAQSANIPLMEGVHIISEDLESAQRGLSSFGAEIIRFNQILEQVEREAGSLILLDEFARGTNPHEGAQIAGAVTRYLNNLPALSVMTTHFDGVADNAGAHYQVIGLRDMDLAEAAARISKAERREEVISRYMNYGLYRVAGEKSCPRDALNICRLLDFKPEILKMLENIY